MKFLRVIFLVLCAVFLVAAFQLERHRVAPLTELDVSSPAGAANESNPSTATGKTDAARARAGKPAKTEKTTEKTARPEKPAATAKAPAKKKRPSFQVFDGFAFTEAATVDGFLLRKGMLFDVYSLRPVSSQSNATLDVKKACPT